MESVPAAPSPPARASSSTLRLLFAVALGAVLGAQGSLLWMSAGGKQLRKDAAATTSIGKFESMLQQPPRGNAKVEELCDPDNCPVKAPEPDPFRGLGKTAVEERTDDRLL